LVTAPKALPETLAQPGNDHKGYSLQPLVWQWFMCNIEQMSFISQRDIHCLQKALLTCSDFL